MNVVMLIMLVLSLVGIGLSITVIARKIDASSRRLLRTGEYALVAAACIPLATCLLFATVSMMGLVVT